MNAPQKSSFSSLGISCIIGVVTLGSILLLWHTGFPSLVRSGPSKTTGIIWRLRLIDAAKQQWAIEHHQTNDVVVTAEDLAPYLTNVVPNGTIEPVADERYRINTLLKVPEAELTRDLEGRPKGTVFRMDKIILPNKSLQATPTSAAVSRCAVTPAACAALAPAPLRNGVATACLSSVR